MSGEHTITIRSIEPVTHDVRRYRCDKPDDYSFRPGQATELRLDRDGWRDEARSFTFTSQHHQQHHDVAPPDVVPS